MMFSSVQCTRESVSATYIARPSAFTSGDVNKLAARLGGSFEAALRHLRADLGAFAIVIPTGATRERALKAAETSALMRSSTLLDLLRGPATTLYTHGRKRARAATACARRRRVHDDDLRAATACA